MQQPEEEYEQPEPGQKRISLWLMGTLGSISIFIFLAIAVLMVVPLPMPGSASGSISKEVEQEVHAIVEGDISEALKILKLKDDGKVYHIEIELLSKPESYDEVSKWTKMMCQRCSGVFKNHEIDRDITVQAKYSKTPYGETYYSHATGKFEFTKGEDF